MLMMGRNVKVVDAMQGRQGRILSWRLMEKTNRGEQELLSMKKGCGFSVDTR